MKIKENIYVLKLPVVNPNAKEFVYPTLIKDGNNLTLIDTGFPGQIDCLKSQIEKEGFKFQNLKNIIITHHDVDHIGNVKAILNLMPNIKIISLDKEADYLNGKKIACKVETMEKNLENLDEKNKQFYKMFKSFFENNKIEVSKTVKDKDIIKNSEEIKVISTPGHTVGHMSLYIEKYKLLIAGDLLVAENGKIANCDKNLNYDNEIYINSLKKIEGLDIDTVICYHGGVVKL